jgi:hypothetical protein
LSQALGLAEKLQAPSTMLCAVVAPTSAVYPPPAGSVVLVLLFIALRFYPPLAGYALCCRPYGQRITDND